jgi:hypothetical protein
MPIEIAVLPRQRLVETRASGQVEDADLLSATDRIAVDPDFDAGFDQLVDLSDATGSSVSPAGLRTMLGRDPIFAPSARRAVVAPEDLGFGLARMFEMHRDGKAGELRVFRARAEALGWLAKPGS